MRDGNLGLGNTRPGSRGAPLCVVRLQDGRSEAPAGEEWRTANCFAGGPETPLDKGGRRLKRKRDHCPRWPRFERPCSPGDAARTARPRANLGRALLPREAPLLRPMPTSQGTQRRRLCGAGVTPRGPVASPRHRGAARPSPSPPAPPKMASPAPPSPPSRGALAPAAPQALQPGRPGSPEELRGPRPRRKGAGGRARAGRWEWRPRAGWPPSDLAAGGAGAVAGQPRRRAPELEEAAAQPARLRRGQPGVLG